jgi:DNA processing protein
MVKVNTLKLSALGYPEALVHIPAAPREIFYIGTPVSEWIDRPKIAVVGSRKATAYGLWAARDLAGQLAAAGIVVISGLAFGIDAAAHQAALRAKGLTVAVLGTGLDHISPSSHYHLAKQILNQQGTIISEYPVDTGGLRPNFVARNRIISGLADGVLIPEAAINSGSLHTARFALEQGKTVMAVPGNINSPTSVGCNNLIKSGAVPITSVEDIYFAMNWRPASFAERNIYKGTPEEEKILELIGQGIRSQEEIAFQSQLNVSTVSSALTMLEIAGAVRPEGAGNWTLA